MSSSSSAAERFDRSMFAMLMQLPGNKPAPYWFLRSKSNESQGFARAAQRALLSGNKIRGPTAFALKRYSRDGSLEQPSLMTNDLGKKMREIVDDIYRCESRRVFA